MKISETKLRGIVRKQLQIKKLEELSKKNLSEAGLSEMKKKPDVDFDPNDLKGITIPAVLKRVLDPNISPMRFAKFDAELDEKGSEKEQAFALLAFALTYADNDPKRAVGLLQQAKILAPRVAKAMENAKSSASSQTPSEEE